MIDRGTHATACLSNLIDRRTSTSNSVNHFSSSRHDYIMYEHFVCFGCLTGEFTMESVCFNGEFRVYGPNLYQRLCWFRCRTCFAGYLLQFDKRLLPRCSFATLDSCLAALSRQATLASLLYFDARLLSRCYFATSESCLVALHFSGMPPLRSGFHAFFSHRLG